jgi:hypothetical protein
VFFAPRPGVGVHQTLIGLLQIHHRVRGHGHVPMGVGQPGMSTCPLPSMMVLFEGGAISPDVICLILRSDFRWLLGFSWASTPSKTPTL